MVVNDIMLEMGLERKFMWGIIRTCLDRIHDLQSTITCWFCKKKCGEEEEEAEAAIVVDKKSEVNALLVSDM